MKRFRWRLQRVLDLTAQRERALKGELLALTQAIVGLHEQVLRRQAAARTALSDLAGLGIERRLAEQQLFMDFAKVTDRQVRRLRRQQRDLEADRHARQREFLRTRASRRTMERLRQEARARYLKEAGRLEQADFDEVAHMASARRG